MLALGAARTAAQSTAAVASGPRALARAKRETNVRRNSGPTQADRDRAAEASETAAKTAGGAFLGLVGSMIGALAAARRRISKSVSDGVQKRKREDLHEPPSTPARHDETIIVPPGA